MQLRESQDIFIMQMEKEMSVNQRWQEEGKRNEQEDDIRKEGEGGQAGVRGRQEARRRIN